uniref:Serine carboxypeptidase 1 n=1 Tax=Oryctolagus cuniculus TaxID=9986 RepID=A0A5F9CSI9_RABIT
MELAPPSRPGPRWLLLLLLLLPLPLLGQSALGAVTDEPTEEGKEVWGYVTVRQDAHMFWWLYYATHPCKNFSELPLVMWLQGGPGGSSTGFGNFQEIGLCSKGPSSAISLGLPWVTPGSPLLIQCSPGDLTCTACLSWTTKVWRRYLMLLSKSWMPSTRGSTRKPLSCGRKQKWSLRRTRTG